MNEQLFRKKSIERVSSPEQLDAYIRVVNPGVWIVLAAIVMLLTGVCAWGILGHLDTTVSAVAICEEDAVILYVKGEEGAAVQKGMEVQIDEEIGLVTEVSVLPVAAGEMLSDYALHVGGFEPEDWVYSIRTDARLSDGVYAAKIVAERVSPISFVVN